MTVTSRPLPAERAQNVESHLRQRVERLATRPQPLGICRSCRAIVHSGDSLAMAGGYLFHGDCPIVSQRGVDGLIAGRRPRALSGSLRIDVHGERHAAVTPVGRHRLHRPPDRGDHVRPRWGGAGPGADHHLRAVAALAAKKWRRTEH